MADSQAHTGSSKKRLLPYSTPVVYHGRPEYFPPISPTTPIVTRFSEDRDEKGDQKLDVLEPASLEELEKISEDLYENVSFLSKLKLSTNLEGQPGPFNIVAGEQYAVLCPHSYRPPEFNQNDKVNYLKGLGELVNNLHLNSYWTRTASTLANRFINGTIFMHDGVPWTLPQPIEGLSRMTHGTKHYIKFIGEEVKNLTPYETSFLVEGIIWVDPRMAIKYSLEMDHFDGPKIIRNELVISSAHNRVITNSAVPKMSAPIFNKKDDSDWAHNLLQIAVMEVAQIVSVFTWHCQPCDYMERDTFLHQGVVAGKICVRWQDLFKDDNGFTIPIDVNTLHVNKVRFLEERHGGHTRTSLYFGGQSTDEKRV